jgi:hypothetical protein
MDFLSKRALHYLPKLKEALWEDQTESTSPSKKIQKEKPLFHPVHNFV